MWAAQRRVLAQSTPVTGEKPAQEAGVGLEPRPGSIQASCPRMGGWAGGQQASQWMGGRGVNRCLGPEPGPPDKPQKFPPSTGRSCLLLTWCVAIATAGVLLPGRTSGQGQLGAPWTWAEVCPRL